MVETFGDYELLDTLGQGGMGVVYRARHVRHTRTVALKRLPPELSRDEMFAARFRQECQIATQLEHEHIVPIYEYGEINGHLFISMRLIEGGDLGARIEDGPLRPAEAVAIVTQIASALDYAHANRIEHRDVKPTNIMVKSGHSDAGGPFAYLVDFGIARSQDMTALTQSGVVGSVAYMAPERVLGEESGARSDAYSLACVLFEALTGGPPFPRPEQQAIQFAHVAAPIPKTSSVNPSVPSALDAVLEKGMAKEPDHRYSTAGEMARAARDAVCAERSSATTVAIDTIPLPGADPAAKPDPLPGPDPPLTPARRRRLGIVAGSIIAAAIAAAAVIWLARGDSAGPNDRAASTPPAPAGPASHVSQKSNRRRSESADVSGPGQAPVSAGACVDASSKLVSCDTRHSFEVFRTSLPCERTSMLRYLGGQPGTDTLVPVVQAMSIKVADKMVCGIRAPTRGSATGTAKDVLLGSRGDSWRLCVGTDTSQTLPCNRPHAGEYVYAATAVSGQTVDCAQKASAYLMAAFVDLESDLRVATATKGDSVACVVLVRGGNVLTASVRSLGTDTLPITPK